MFHIKLCFVQYMFHIKLCFVQYMFHIKLRFVQYMFHIKLCFVQYMFHIKLCFVEYMFHIKLCSVEYMFHNKLCFVQYMFHIINKLCEVVKLNFTSFQRYTEWTRKKRSPCCFLHKQYQTVSLKLVSLHIISETIMDYFY